jgi:Protein of unknown function (DUF1501)
MEPPRNDGISRRAALGKTACGFAALALKGLLAEFDGLLAMPGVENPLALRPPHFTPKAKRVIFLFMHGGPSHLDTFDPKPRLDRDHGKPIPFQRSLTFSPAKELGGLMKSPFSFKQYGQSGLPVSELFPHVATCVDDLCIIRSMVGDGVDHGGAMLQLHTGSFTFTRPCMGSWVLLGLGTENQNLPGFITIKPTLWHGGEKNWSSSFLPGAYQGTPIGYSAMKIEDIQKQPIEYLANARLTTEQQRYELEMLHKVNRQHAFYRELDPNLEARIQALELAFRMQAEAPEVLEIEKESEATKKLYGLDDETTRDFGWQCLMARRFAERGVRFIQCSHSGKEEKWDQHTKLAQMHYKSAREVDKPIAGLLKDLKARGLLADTLVIWGGEFGRTPFAQYDGRDHNPYGFTIWIAGGGVKPGMVYGTTDEFGYHAIEQRMHIHDFHATILHLMGLDHEKLTYQYAGRNFRLTDIHGTVAHEIVA